MDGNNMEQSFIDTMSRWLISLPHDLKVLYELSDNENLDRTTRELAVGALIYTISPNDFIADRYDTFASYCDDCIMVRMAMHQALSSGGEDIEQFKQRFPEFFEPLDDELAICRAVMDDLYDWLLSKIPGLAKLEYKGKGVAVFLDDSEASELLYEDGLAFTTEYPVEEDTLGDKLKKVSTILEVIRRRKAEEARQG